MVVDSVEGNLLENERREILRFIEKQDNIFSKIENNINQVAKIANAQKYIKKKDFYWAFTAQVSNITSGIILLPLMLITLNKIEYKSTARGSRPLVSLIAWE